MRSATSHTCGMLWLIRITPRPRSRSDSTSRSTWADSLTPSAAVGSSRTTTLPPNAAARATATAWRCPPERDSTATDMFCTVEMPRSQHRLLGPLAHALLVEHAEHAPQRSGATLLAGEVEVGGDVERRGDGEGLVDGLDPGLPGVLRTLEGDRPAVHPDLARVGHQGTGEGLDQGGLAGPVVPDDRQHLPAVQVHVDAVEADDPTEGLHQPASREDRGVVVVAHARTRFAPCAHEAHVALCWMTRSLRSLMRVPS